MGNPGAPRPLERRYSNHPMLPREEPDELEVVEVRKEEPNGLSEEPAIPHKGKLYLLAEIRVMTEEKLREMFGG